MLIAESYEMPTRLDAALKLWRSAPPGSRLVAGATDTLPWARQGRAGDVRVPLVVDISNVEDLDGYTIEGNRVRIGANVVFQDFLEDETLRRHLPSMPLCAVWFADDQIRRQATLVGNIVNASPAADGTPPMIAMNADVEIGLRSGVDVSYRRMPLEDFVTGPGATALEAGEIVTAVICDSCVDYGGSFEKVGQRRSLVISAVCTSCLVKPNKEGTHFEDIRIAMGGTGPVPLRLRDVEEALKGRAISEAAISEIAAMPTDRIQSRTRRAYRRDVVAGFVARGLENALKDCGIELAGVAGGEQEVINV